MKGNNTLEENKKNIEEDLKVEENDTVNEESVTLETNEELEKLKKENTELSDKLHRNLAEFDNFRKRTEKEKSQMFSNGVTSTIEKLLPVLDNFERALNAQNDKEGDFYKGISMINKQFITLLNELGVKEIEALNNNFDPNLHYAVSHEENDEFEENTVIEVMQKGYTYNEKVIRFSMVKVAN